MFGLEERKYEEVCYEIVHGDRKDTQTNEYISLYPIMDFNQSFGCYDTLEGANCQTVYPERKTQREAAIEAVQQIGFH